MLRKTRLLSAFLVIGAAAAADAACRADAYLCRPMPTFAYLDREGAPGVDAPLPPPYFFIAASITECVQAPSGFLVMTGSDLPPNSVATVRS